MSLPLVSIGKEVITVAAASIGFTDALLTVNTVLAVCRLDTANIRFNTVQGEDASATDDTPAWPGDEFVVVTMRDMKNFRAIREGDASAALYVTYMGIP